MTVAQRVLKRHSPRFLATWAVRRSMGLLTGRLRLLPDFVIIGAQRCGTTSLFNYLTQHSDVAPSCPKEVHYFTLYYDRGESWYRSHFPLARQKDAARRSGRSFAAGEATPYCLMHPHAPRRAADTIPEARLIVLLRNPVDRAYSHYHYEVEMGAETLSFEAALEAEEARISGEYRKLLEDEHYRSFNYQHYTYLTRGRYAEQLERWFACYRREQILVLKSEDLHRDPRGTLDTVTAFLELPAGDFSGFERHNRLRYRPMDPALRERLGDVFRDANRRLYDLLNADFGWDV